MQVQTPRKASTMARRVLETSFPQKGPKSHSSPTRKQAFHPHRSHNPLRSSLSSTHSHRSLNPLRSSLSSTHSAPTIPARAPPPAQPHSQHTTAQYSEMPTIITTSLRNLLTENGLQGFIQVAEAPPHPNATEIVSRLNNETITDSMLRKKLNLDNTSEWQLEMVPSHILERYYGKYSLSAKAFQTRDIPDPSSRMWRSSCSRLGACTSTRMECRSTRQGSCSPRTRAPRSIGAQSQGWP